MRTTSHEDILDGASFSFGGHPDGKVSASGSMDAMAQAVGEAAAQTMDEAAAQVEQTANLATRLLAHSSRWSKAAFLGFVVAAAALAVYAACGFVQAPLPATVASTVLLVLLGCACVARDFRSATALNAWRKVRPIAIVCAVPVGFYLMERPYNEVFPFMEPASVPLNLVILALALAMLFLLGQRSRFALGLFLTLCMVSGTANHFVTLFKGQPILPSDVLALSTALEVGGEYSYTLDATMLEVICVFSACLALIAYLPKVSLRPRSVVVNLLLAVVLAGCSYNAYRTIDFEEDFDVQIDIWSPGGAYSTKGSALCFVKRMQDLTPEAPAGYSPQAADSLLKEYGTSLPEGGADGTGSTGNTGGAAANQSPTVIAIMNESFSDLSSFPTLEGSNAVPELYYVLASGSLESGAAYVSARGGGTCNSEFEFLACSTNGFLGAGVYPYVECSLDGSETLPAYFSNLGYATHAIHPNEASNWRRDTVYQQMGFDDFAAIDAFEGADTLRELVTDKETYDLILQMLETDAGPQFIFDVTMQNHGGYEKGVDPSIYVHVDTPASQNAAELSEYVSVVRRSELDLLDFLESLEVLERPVLLCFFGDHQPGFNETLWTETHDGQGLEDAGIDSVQECWNTTYMIWANASARSQLGYSAVEALDYEALRETYAELYANDEGSDEGPNNEADAGNEVTDAEGEASGDDADASAADETSKAFEENAESAAAVVDDAAAENTSEGEADGLKPPDTEDEEDAASAAAAAEAQRIMNLKTAATADAAHSKPTSLNYLGARLVSIAGLPSTPYQSSLKSASAQIPVINLNGYMLADGSWHTFGEDGSDAQSEQECYSIEQACETLADLRILQYDNLFNKSVTRSSLWYSLQYDPWANWMSWE